MHAANAWTIAPNSTSSSQTTLIHDLRSGRPVVHTIHQARRSKRRHRLDDNGTLEAGREPPYWHKAFMSLQEVVHAVLQDAKTFSIEESEIVLQRQNQFFEGQAVSTNVIRLMIPC